MPVLTFLPDLDDPSDPESPYYNIEVYMGEEALPSDLGYLDLTSIHKSYN